MSNSFSSTSTAGRMASVAMLSALIWFGFQAGAGAAPAVTHSVPGGTEPVAVAELGPDELADLVAPIALYPDDLLAIVLPASTYPLQIVQAARFLEAAESDSGLTPDETWDDAVVALLNYPEVVELLSEDLDWTWSLGQAVLAQQTEVLAAVEDFRDRAYTAGNLRTDERQIVEVDDGAIYIKPADPQVIYVPYYEPAQVTVYQRAPVYYYHPRPYPVYYYPYPAGYTFASGYFWGVTTVYSLGWGARHLYISPHDYYGHPFYGRSYVHNHYYYRQPTRIVNHYYYPPATPRYADERRDDTRHYGGHQWRPDTRRVGARPHWSKDRDDRRHSRTGDTSRYRDQERNVERVRQTEQRTPRNAVTQTDNRIRDGSRPDVRRTGESFERQMPRDASERVRRQDPQQAQQTGGEQPSRSERQERPERQERQAQLETAGRTERARTERALQERARTEPERQQQPRTRTEERAGTARVNPDRTPRGPAATRFDPATAERSRYGTAPGLEQRHRQEAALTQARPNPTLQQLRPSPPASHATPAQHARPAQDARPARTRAQPQQMPPDSPAQAGNRAPAQAGNRGNREFRADQGRTRRADVDQQEGSDR